MTPNTIGSIIRRLDINKMQPHSVINHHVDGLDYLCLHRSEDLTVKIYIMEEPKNVNSGLLVNPHSHRYAFSTCILNGVVEHVKYVKVEGDEWEEYQYDPDARKAVVSGIFGLEPSARSHGYRSDYWCSADEIHSIRCRPECGPLVLNLTQLHDEKKHSELYLPKGSNGQYIKPNSCIPTLAEMRLMIEKALFYVDRHFNVYDKSRPDLYGNGVRSYLRALQQDKS